VRIQQYCKPKVKATPDQKHAEVSSPSFGVVRTISLSFHPKSNDRCYPLRPKSWYFSTQSQIVYLCLQAEKSDTVSDATSLVLLIRKRFTAALRFLRSKDCEILLAITQFFERFCIFIARFSG
jgi:hypothetical protein